MTAGRWQLAAIAGAGALVFAGGAIALAHDRLLPGDAGTFHLLAHLRAGWVTDAAKALTWLGAAPVAWSAVGTAAVVLAVRGRPLEAAVLVVGIALIAVAVHFTKAAVDRPRPLHPLVGTHERSYPSGHAAYVVGYVAMAMAARRRRLLAAGLAAALVVGLTRVYLRAHYLSDVLGGFGLSAAIFALGGLLVARVRHNEGDAP